MRCDLDQIGGELFIEDCESEGGNSGRSAKTKALLMKNQNEST